MGESLSLGWLSIVPVLISIVGSIATRKPFQSLLAGSLVGCIIAYGPHFLTEWVNVLQFTVSDNTWIIVVAGLFGSLIAMLKKTHGTAGFVKYAGRICKTARSTKLCTFVLGCIIFVDDYLNMLTVGVCMRGVCDKRGIPRESLAFMLDSTGTPVCMLLPFSTWGAYYISLFMDQPEVQAMGYSSGMDMFVHLIPFNFYAILCVVIILLFAIGIIPPVLGMKKAYQRMADGGKPWSERSEHLNKDADEETAEDGQLIDFLLPMAVLIAVTFIVDILAGVAVALAVCLVLYVPRKKMTINEWADTLFEGFCDMIPTLISLMAAFMVANTSTAMGLTPFILNAASGYPFPATLPAIMFLIVAAVTFSTGSFWGTAAIVTPILLPLAEVTHSSVILAMAAILCGCTFGSHACFFADATMLAAQASKIEVMDHNFTQLPYIVLASLLTIILFSVFGVIMT